MKKITVYSMQNCPYCVKAKNLLTQRGLKFDIEMIDEWTDVQWDQFVKKTGMKTVPQIFVDDKLIGGYTQLAEVDSKDQLQSFK